MTISKDLLDILCCPDTKEDVHLISNEKVEIINKAITAGVIKIRSGKVETHSIDSGLLRADGKYLYPIRDDIPIMLIDEAIDMSTVE